MICSVFASSTIPLIFMAVYSRPYVISVHLRLPLHARATPVNLAQFTKNIPTNCKMQISTMRLVPVPRIQQVRIEDLRKVTPRFGSIVNLELLDTTASTGTDPKIQPQSKGFWTKPMKKFCVAENKISAQRAVIWDWVWSRIPAK